MPQQFRILDDGRVLIIGMVPGDGLMADVNALRGDLEHGVVIDGSVAEDLRRTLSGGPAGAVRGGPVEEKPLLRPQVEDDPDA
jgi:hypothetical protein